MKPKTNRRCTECSQEYVVDPRAGDRQVTCGAESCQQARHAERCRLWRESNKEEGARSHYEDVVRPFRLKQPSYQRRWRLRKRLREIREKMHVRAGVVGSAITGVLEQLKALVQQRAAEAQTGVFSGKSVDEAVAAVQGVAAALEQLDASMARLAEVTS